MSRFSKNRIAHASRALAFALLLLFPGASTSRAAAFSWLSGVNGAIDDPNRWSPFGVPDSVAVLTYDVPGTYTVDFTQGVPKTHTQTFKTGLVTINSPASHAVHQFTLDGAHVWVDGGSIVGRFEDGAWMSIAKAQLTLDHGAQFTGGGYVAGDHPASLNVARGSRLHLTKWLDVKLIGSVLVWGSDANTGLFSGIDQGPLGLSVGGNFFAYDGGFVDVLGAVHITGGPSNSLQSIHVGPGAPASASYLNTQSDLIVGKKYGSESIMLFGIAEFNVKDRAWAHIGGRTVVGDSVGDQGCAVRVLQGGTFIGSGGFKVFTTVGAGLDMQGGITHLRGGQFQWPANKMLTVSSHVGTPELWIGNGGTNVGPDYGSPSIVALMVGRGGNGTLRVTRPGTVLPVTGAMAVGDSLGGIGTVVADSSGTLAITGSLSVGTNGNGSVRVRNGAQVSAATTYIAAGLTGNGNIEVTGPGSSLVAKDKIHVGGGELGSGGTGALVLDSLATVTVVQNGINPSSVVVHPTAGVLVLDNGAVLNTGALDGRGAIFMHGGAINGLSASLGTTGRLNGHGAIGGHLFTSGSISPAAMADNFGSFAVGGNFRQFSSGHYRVHLGASGGLRSDTLVVSGNANLDGTLDITLDPSFQVQPLDTFTILTCGSRTGTFAAITWNGQPLAGEVQVLYQDNAVRLVVPQFPVSVDPVDASQDLRFAPVGSRGQVSFELDLPAAADVKVALYDVTGRHVVTLADGAMAGGRHTLSVAPRHDLSSGVYFARAVVRSQGRTDERVVKAALLR